MQISAGTLRASTKVKTHGEALSRSKIGWRSDQAANNHVLKRSFDIAVATLLVFPLLIVAIFLILLNPFFNPGSLFFSQTRMGKDGNPIQTWKFRSMQPTDHIERGAFDALDRHRITPIGCFLRKTRLDELPQILNVLKGEMSLIGPRPDIYEYAQVYVEQIPGYRDRLISRPGISGYAQVVVGYVEGLEGMRAKVAADLYYLQNASARLDLWIVWRTICIVVGKKGC